MQITNISDAKASLSKLIRQIQETNEPVIIGKAGKPIAILSAFNNKHTPRELGGSWEGKVSMSEDFNDADEEIMESFYHSSIFPESK